MNRSSAAFAIPDHLPIKHIMMMQVISGRLPVSAVAGLFPQIELASM